jgi:hypothetical protein
MHPTKSRDRELQRNFETRDNDYFSYLLSEDCLEGHESSIGGGGSTHLLGMLTTF